MVENNYGNTLRFFSSSVTLPWTAEGNIHPYLKVGNKFDLRTVNKAWLKNLHDRIKYFIDREGTIILTLIDGCSLHNLEEGWWSRHFWNGRNNINGTSRKAGSIYSIFAPETAAESRSAHFIVHYIRSLVTWLEYEFLGSIVYDFNEVRAPWKWYIRMDKEILEPLGVPKHRKMFSYLKKRKNVFRLMGRYFWQPHNIDNLNDYISLDRHHLWRLVPSGDGCASWDKNKVRNITKAMLEKGDRGIENNRLRGKEQCGLFCHVDWKRAEVMREAFIEWYDLYANK